jgi:hypothetical protein
VIDETRAPLIKRGVTPNFVVTFRGPATRLVQTDMTKVKPEEREVAAKIARSPRDQQGAGRELDGTRSLSGGRTGPRTFCPSSPSSATAGSR